MGSFAGAFGGLLASAILTMDSFGSLRQWRMIFAVEGIITCCLAIIAFFTMTDRPETARWLTQEEKELAIARVKSERVGVTDILDKISWTKIFRGILSPATLATSFIFLFTNITVQGLAFFAPTIVRTIYPNASVVTQQLRTVPPYIVGTFFTVLINWLSSRFDRRNIFINLSAPPVMIGYIMFLATNSPYARYAATFLITSGAFANGALSNAQVSANLLSDTARSSGIGMNVMCGNIGGLIVSDFPPGAFQDLHYIMRLPTDITETEHMVIPPLRRTQLPDRQRPELGSQQHDFLVQWIAVLVLQVG